MGTDPGGKRLGAEEVFIVVMQGNGILTGSDRSRVFAGPYSGPTDSPPSETFLPPEDPVWNDLCRVAAHVSRSPWTFLARWDGSRGAILGNHAWDACPLSTTDALLARLLPRFANDADHVLIPDARSDETVRDSALVVGAPGVRFLAAVPLRDDYGAVVGFLCAFGPRVQLLDTDQIASLRSLAAPASALLRLRNRLAEAEITAARSGQAESAHWQARHDPLTGLPNRTLFHERLQEWLARRDAAEAQLADLFMDLNGFKNINDTLGHAAGDMVLREVADRFAACLRAEDTLARFGGDEFTVMLEDVPDATYAANVAQMLLQALRRPVVLAGEELTVSTSVGVALYPQDGADAQTLLKNADVAMYEAKAQGGFRMYSREMNADIYQRLIQEGELHRAVEREELTLAYQPQIELATGAVCTVEALTRWRHPDWGNVPADHFIELAEQSDLIVPLGEWVLRRACADCARWRDEGRLPGLRVAVNLSARQVAHPGLFDAVSRALADAGLPGDALELELTETALISGGDGIPEKIAALRALGVRVLIAAFGTGYSSLTCLRHCRVDAIKLDRAFVAGIGRANPDEALLRAMVHMARALKVGVTAEGVENQAQHDFLDGLGCDRAQGYLYSKPMPYEQLVSVCAGRATVIA